MPVRFFDYVNQKASDTRPSTTLEIQEGQPAPAAGLTFLQIAREGLGFQKTQNGGGAIPNPAPQNTAYHRYGSRVNAGGQRDIVLRWHRRVARRASRRSAQGDTKFLKDGLSGIARDAADALRQYTPDRPAAIAPLLADGLKSTRALIDQVRASKLADPGKSDVLFELGVKEEQFQRALAAALEVSLQTTVAAERPHGLPVVEAEALPAADAPSAPAWRWSGTGRTDVYDRDSGPVVQRRGQHFQRECRRR